MKTENDRTPAQQEAVMTTEEAVLLLAGPGSGKTKTVVDRIVKLILDGVNPKSIVCITFTNAGARVLEDRLAKAIDTEVLPGAGEGFKEKILGYCGTLHGFALQMLREHGEFMGYGARISVVSPESAATLLESKARSLGCKTSMKQLLEVKRAGIPKTRMSVEQTVVELYLDELRTAGIVDYDLILSEFDRMMGESGAGYGALGMIYDYLFVDEVQDSAEADWRIYRNLGMHWKFFVGDPDQSIYGFRGAALDEMIAFGEDLGTHVIKLEENFRSASLVCEAANRLISHNLRRLPKETKSMVGGVSWIESLGLLLTEGAELAAVAHKIVELREDHAGLSIAILARTNHLAGVFRNTLSAGGVIPIRGREELDLPRDWSFARSVVELLADPDNDTLAYFNMVASATKDGRLTPKKAAELAHQLKVQAAATGISINKRVMKYPVCRTANDAAIALSDLEVSLESRMIIGEKLKALPRDASVLDLALAMAYTKETIEIDGNDDLAGKPVEVSTLHGAKGREFDVVFLVGFEDEVIPGRRKDADIEEERRLAYVGLTRARFSVYISGAEQRITKWGSHEKHTASRFAKEIFG